MTAQALVQSWFEATLAASSLAMVLTLLGRRILGPNMRRIAWSLVLLKFILPPIYAISIEPIYAKYSSWFSPEIKVHVNTELIEEPIASFIPGEISVNNPFQPDFAVAEIGKVGNNIEMSKTDIVMAEFKASGTSSWSVSKDFLLQSLVGIWGLGLFCQWVKYGRNAKNLRLLRKTLDDAKDNDQKLLSEIAVAMKIKSRRLPELKMTCAAVSPMMLSSGFRSNAVIILPEELWSGWGERQRKAVLAHELAHLKRRDDMLAWLGLAVQCLQWFNPLARWATRQWKEAGEEAADALALATLGGSSQARRDLAGVILQSVEWLNSGGFNSGEFQPALAMATPGRDARLLKKRIVNIGRFSLKLHEATRRRTALALVLSILILPFGVMTRADSNGSELLTDVNAPAPADETAPNQPPSDVSLAASLPQQYRALIRDWNNRFDERIAEIRELSDREMELQHKYKRVEAIVRDEPKIREAFEIAANQFKSETQTLKKTRMEAVAQLRKEEAEFNRQLQPMRERMKMAALDLQAGEISIRQTAGNLVEGGLIEPQERIRVGLPLLSSEPRVSLDARVRLMETKVWLIQAELQELKQARARKLASRRTRPAGQENAAGD